MRPLPRPLKRLLRACGALLLAVAVAFALGVLWPLEEPPLPGPREDFALRGVTVVDTRGDADLANATVLIRAGRIAAVGPADTVSLPSGLTVIDAPGKFLIPGLCDMHAHVIKHAEQLQLPLYLAHGVTGLRDMLSWQDDSNVQALSIAAKRALHQRVEQGTLAGPRMLAIASYLADGPSPRLAALPAFFNLRTPEEARAFVAHEAARGADFIKMYNRVPREAYFALLDEAHRRGLPVAGHRPYTVSLEEAAHAGQRSIEHGRDLLLRLLPRHRALPRRHAGSRAPCPLAAPHARAARAGPVRRAPGAAGPEGRLVGAHACRAPRGRAGG